MMFYSPYELFSHINTSNLTNYENIKKLPRNTEIEKLRADFCENDFNIRFLESINKEFFSNIIIQLNNKKEYLINQINELNKKSIKKPVNEKPLKRQ